MLVLMMFTFKTIFFERNIQNHMAFDISIELAGMNNNPRKENLENTEPFVGMEFESEEAANVLYT